MSEQPTRPPQAIRLTFAYGPEGVRLLSRQPVAMVVPPTDPIAATPPPGRGVTAELRAADDRPVFRRVLQQAIPSDVEVFDPDAEGGVFRAPVAPRSGVFTVLVPDDAEADELILLAAPQELPESMEAPPGPEAAPGIVELGRFRVREEGGGGVV